MRDVVAARVFLGRGQGENADGRSRGIRPGVGLLHEDSEVGRGTSSRIHRGRALGGGVGRGTSSKKKVCRRVRDSSRGRVLDRIEGIER